MSVIGKSLSDPTPVQIAQPVVVVSADGTVNSQTGTSNTNPTYTAPAQGLIASGSVNLEAGVAATIMSALPGMRGIRILNYISAPVYIANGTSGTPASGAGSDYIPAAAAGVPGVLNLPYVPVNGLRAVCASAGGLTVTVW